MIFSAINLDGPPPLEITSLESQICNQTILELVTPTRTDVQSDLPCEGVDFIHKTAQTR